MPRMNDPDMESGAFGSGRGFQFSSTRLDKLGATSYTLVTIALDHSGSTWDFRDLLRKFLIMSVQGCRKSPRANNLLVRVIKFSTSLPGGIEEIHGFKLLSEIDPQAYPEFNPMGDTPLYDAGYSSPGAINAYAKQLAEKDFLANGIFYLVTDGLENASTATLKMVKAEMERGRKREEIESLIGIVIGINDDEPGIEQGLRGFCDATGMRYVKGGDATEGRLAKAADFVSQSISSQAQAAGTGGPSQDISASF